MKSVFLGASRFGLRCLKALLQLDDFSVEGVLTAPREFSISYRPTGVTNVLHEDIEGFCIANSLPHLVLRNSMHDKALLEQVKTWKPDMFLVVGWYHLVPRNWRELAPAFGLHASLLPDYSGGAPLVWAMINGEKKTGITLFQLDDGVDSGPILGQRSAEIKENDTIATLYSRIEELGLDLVSKLLPGLTNGSAKLTPQDHNKRRVFPQRGPEDGLVDWTQSAAALDRFVRAQTRPYPGAFTTWAGKPITLWRVRRVPGKKQLPGLRCGQVLQDSNAMLVNTAEGTLEILEVTYEESVIDGSRLRKIVPEGTVLGT